MPDKAKHPQIIVSHHKTQEGNSGDDVIARREICRVIDRRGKTFKFGGELDDRAESLVKI